MDKSGASAIPMEGSNVEPEYRLNYFQVKAAQKHLSGTCLTQMTEHSMKVLRRRIHESDIGDQWTEMPDLFTFLQHEVFSAAVESLTETYLLNQFPGFVDDFWEFDRSVPTMIKGLPHWLAPRPYKVRQRLLDAVKSWHKYARQHSDSSKTAPEDPEWDPLWESKLMRAREEYSKGVDFMNEDALAAEDLGLIFAMNTNAVPAVAWLIIELYRDKTLLSRAQAEVQAAHRPTPGLEQAELDIVKLCNSPLLQSVYAETLRLRVAILLMRTPKREDFHMGQWMFPKCRPILFSSRTAALNPEIWNVGTAQDPRPLEYFCADRFLVSCSDPMSGPSKKDPSQSGKASPEIAAPDEQADNSDARQAGRYVFRHGENSCRMASVRRESENVPEQAFCKARAEDWVPRPDMRYFPFGGLPPIGKVPFRIRRR
ncbi:MAG: hypothetical protein Q9203_005665 [Teloschistes exilis]